MTPKSELAKMRLLPQEDYQSHRTYIVREQETETHRTRHLLHVRAKDKDDDGNEWKTTERREKYLCVNGPLKGKRLTTDDSRIEQHQYALWNRSGGHLTHLPKAIFVKL